MLSIPRICILSSQKQKVKNCSGEVETTNWEGVNLKTDVKPQPLKNNDETEITNTDYNDHVASKKHDSGEDFSTLEEDPNYARRKRVKCEASEYNDAEDTMGILSHESKANKSLEQSVSVVIPAIFKSAPSFQSKSMKKEGSEEKNTLEHYSRESSGPVKIQPGLSNTSQAAAEMINSRDGSTVPEPVAELMAEEHVLNNSSVTKISSEKELDKEKTKELPRGVEETSKPVILTQVSDEPPAKVLKLNANGTLGFPVKAAQKEENLIPGQAQKASPRTSLRRSTRTVISTKLTTSQVVVLTYKEPSTSERIQKVLASPPLPAGSSKLSSEAKKEKKQDQGVGAKPKVPPKNLHPFFKKGGAADAISQTPKVKVEKQNVPGGKTLIIGAEPGTSSLRIAATPHFARPLVKTSSTKDAPWPWQGVVRVEDNTTSPTAGSDSSTVHPRISTRRKNKGVIHNVTDSENILRSFKHPIDDVLQRTPQRQLHSCLEVQQRLQSELKPCPETSTSKSARLIHPAIQDVVDRTKDYLSPWDKNGYESQSWLQKYAPTKAGHVLQDGNEAFVLKEWLKALQVNNVDSGKHSRRPIKTMEDKPKRSKKRKSDMDDFIIDESDEDAYLEDDWSDVEDGSSRRRPSAMRSQVLRPHPEAKSLGWRPPNAILLSGPNGCGKTAAVYAVAKEMDFEVFEINASSRRSGKDILDRIGNMLDNHLVQQVSKAVKEREKRQTTGQPSIEPSSDSKEGRQGNMDTFFKIKASGTVVKEGKPSIADNKVIFKADITSDPSQAQQKQSMILIEEFDVLFSEDKQFWATIKELVKLSKRPIVFTCNNEARLGVNIPFYARLRFVPPMEEVACGYLTAIATREGHFLSPESIRSLYLSTGLDLRASIATMNFWCQTGIGSDKWGLDWMIDRYPVGCDFGLDGHPLRAISVDTYNAGQGWISQNTAAMSRNATTSDGESAELSTMIQDLNLSNEDLVTNPSTYIYPSECDGVFLDEFAFIADCLSSLDIACQGIMRSGLHTRLDQSHPMPTEKRMLDSLFAEPSILSEPALQFHDLDAAMSSAVLVNARSLARKSRAARSDNLGDIQQSTAGLHSFALSTIHKKAALLTYGSVPTLKRSHFSAALDLLADPDPENPSDTLQLSSFDRAFSIITLDLAPYARSIARHDLMVERDKAALLSSSQKRVRLSRVSRSAADGGRREETRQQRKLPGSVNLKAVVETGGKRWESGGCDGVLPDLGSVKMLSGVSNGLVGSRYLSDMDRTV